MKICSICNINKPLADYYSNGKTSKGTTKYKPYCKPCEIEFRRDSFLKKITNIIGKLECEVCQYNKCKNALEFHHLDPTEKDFEIGKFYNCSEAVLAQEIEKCILLCSNCHRELHDGILVLSGPLAQW